MERELCFKKNVLSRGSKFKKRNIIQLQEGYMNKVFVLVFLCIFSTIILNAQDSVLVKNNALQEQKWALQFQVNGINLYSFQKAEGYFNNTSSSASGEISLQKSISLNSALRFGVGMSLSKAYSDAVVKQQDNDISINC